MIDWPREAVAESFTVSALTIAELAYGLHLDDPLVSAAREARYRMVLSIFEPIPYSARAAHLYGAIAASVRKSGRNPHPRRIDLMVASAAGADCASWLTNLVDQPSLGTWQPSSRSSTRRRICPPCSPRWRRGKRS